MTTDPLQLFDQWFAEAREAEINDPEAMAATYIESLRSVQPEGPYLLVAFCGGSPIAFEMA